MDENNDRPSTQLVDQLMNAATSKIITAHMAEVVKVLLCPKK